MWVRVVGQESATICCTLTTNDQQRLAKLQAKFISQLEPALLGSMDCPIDHKLPQTRLTALAQALLCLNYFQSYIYNATSTYSKLSIIITALVENVKITSYPPGLSGTFSEICCCIFFQTDYEGQIKTLTQYIDPKTDGIIVAGGDGTLLEVSKQHFL